jgi:hypothetical protein
MLQRFSSISFPLILSLADFQILSQDIYSHGDKVIELITGTEGPINSSGEGGGLIWEADWRFGKRTAKKEEDHFHLCFDAEMTSCGMLSHFDQHVSSMFESNMDIFFGYIPLPVMPFLINGDWDEEQKKDFTKENKIRVFPAANDLLKGKVVYSDKKILPKNGDALIKKAFPVQFFDPSDLKVQQIREALGLEICEDPIPQGVYLLKDDLGLGGLYVEGGLDSVVLSIEDSYQVIKFTSGENVWEIKFSPPLSRTVFHSPDEVEMYELVPKGIIIVNGDIASLSGRKTEGIDAAGEEKPCLLQGINLTILSPETITISSSLQYQGITWKENIPYVKDGDTQLNIFSTGKELFGGTEKEGHIVITENASSSMTLHGSYTACGKGITVKGTGAHVRIFGGVHTSSIQASGCEIEVIPDVRFYDRPQHLKNSPTTACPVLILSSFKPVGWKDR